jgi:hypothetical protein
MLALPMLYSNRALADVRRADSDAQISTHSCGLDDGDREAGDRGVREFGG